MRLAKDLDGDYLTEDECVQCCLNTVMAYSSNEKKDAETGSVSIGDVLGVLTDTMSSVDALRPELSEIAGAALKDIQEEDILKKKEEMLNRIEEIREKYGKDDGK